MTKQEFLDILSQSLKVSEAEKKDIIYDYEEHFSIGIENGKTEQELINELGDPKTIAKQYTAAQNLQRAKETPSTKNIFIAVLSAVSLGFFNLIFVLGPFLGLICLILGLFVASCGITISGIGMMFGTMLGPIFPNLIGIAAEIPYSALLLFGIGMTALGILCFIGSYYAAKYFYNITIKYLKWNLNIIKK